MEELHPACETLRPQIKSLLRTCDKIINSSSIKSFFTYILTLGNFINTVSRVLHYTIALIFQEIFESITIFFSQCRTLLTTSSIWRERGIPSLQVISCVMLEKNYNEQFNYSIAIYPRVHFHNHQCSVFISLKEIVWLFLFKKIILFSFLSHICDPTYFVLVNTGCTVLVHIRSYPPSESHRKFH